MEIKKVIKKINLKDSQPETLGEHVTRKVLFSPSKTENNFLKLAYLDVPSGAKTAPHIHLGEEAIFTLQGKAILKIEDKEYILEEGTAFIVPPDVGHPIEVPEGGKWVAVAAYCDECPVLKKFRDKENKDYPLDI